MTTEIHIQSLKALRKWAQSLVKSLQRPSLILLSGEPGSGKTQLVQFLVEELGGSGVSSPTFALQHRYRTPVCEVAHFDLYRVESEDDLETTGLWEAFDLDQGLVIVEWPNLIAGIQPPAGWQRIHVQMEVLEGGERRVLLTQP